MRFQSNGKQLDPETYAKHLLWRSKLPMDNPLSFYHQRYHQILNRLFMVAMFIMWQFVVWVLYSEKIIQAGIGFTKESAFFVNIAVSIIIPLMLSAVLGTIVIVEKVFSYFKKWILAKD